MSFDLTSEEDRLALVANVFQYPSKPHRRKHGPFGYTTYESFRDWLRDEFSYRCVFSLFRETWPQTRFHIDHLISQNERPDLACDYDNLILLESRLNLVKSKRRVPDPCQIALGKCLFVHTAGDQIGRIEPRDGSKIGERIIGVLRLDSEDATNTRRLWLEILRLAARANEKLFRELIGYPADLPDLHAARVQNSRNPGLQQSARSLRDRDALPEWY